MSANAKVGTGTTITFGTSTGFTPKVLDMQVFSMSREAINTSDFSTTAAHTFIPADLVDFGDLTLEIEWDAATSVTVPYGAAAETITITPKGGGSVAFSGFITEYTPSIPMEDKMTASITIKVTGDITDAGPS